MTTDMEGEKEYQATKEELKAQKRRCWWTGCKHKAFLEDMCWSWCLYHWWHTWRWGGGEVSLRSFYHYMKFTRVF